MQAIIVIVSIAIKRIIKDIVFLKQYIFSTDLPKIKMTLDENAL